MNRAAAAATRVLVSNWRGRYTVPARGLYPHQWSWDSGFIAIGLRHISPRRAQIELDSIFSAQWDDGRIPQIVFDLRKDDGYSPGASFWHSEHIAGSPPVPTAGLIQPPNHALAVWLTHQSDPEESERRGFLPRAYDHLVAWHAYLRERRGTPSGLARIVHPWEGGMDNSPFWDAALAAIDVGYGRAIPRPDLRHTPADHRPSDAEYDKYLYLAARYRDHNCDDLDTGHPFQFEDPAVNALWAASEHALAAIAQEIGADPQPHRAEELRIGRALESLWHKRLGIYVARDLVSGHLQQYRTVSGLIPLLVHDRHAAKLLETLTGPHFGLGEVAMVPSHDLTATTFDASRYWRGPSWFNTAWMIADALYEGGNIRPARELARRMVDLAVEHDFPEYVDPHTGEPRGSRQFSWTAALTLDLITRMEPGE